MINSRNPLFYCVDDVAITARRIIVNHLPDDSKCVQLQLFTTHSVSRDHLQPLKFEPLKFQFPRPVGLEKKHVILM